MPRRKTTRSSAPHFPEPKVLFPWNELGITCLHPIDDRNVNDCLLTPGLIVHRGLQSSPVPPHGPAPKRVLASQGTAPNGLPPRSCPTPQTRGRVGGSFDGAPSLPGSRRVEPHVTARRNDLLAFGRQQEAKELGDRRR